MSLWEFRAVCGGYAKANGAEEQGLNREEFDQLAALIDEPSAF